MQFNKVNSVGKAADIQRLKRSGPGISMLGYNLSGYACDGNRQRYAAACNFTYKNLVVCRHGIDLHGVFPG